MRWYFSPRNASQNTRNEKQKEKIGYAWWDNFEEVSRKYCPRTCSNKYKKTYEYREELCIFKVVPPGMDWKQYAAEEGDNVMAALESSRPGLSSREAQRRLRAHPDNQLKAGPSALIGTLKERLSSAFLYI